MFPHSLDQHLQCNQIFATFRNNNIRTAFARFYKLFMHRFYRCQILTSSCPKLLISSFARVVFPLPVPPAIPINIVSMLTLQ